MLPQHGGSNIQLPVPYMQTQYMPFHPYSQARLCAYQPLLLEARDIRTTALLTNKEGRTSEKEAKKELPNYYEFTQEKKKDQIGIIPL